ncbi:hypothetical protein X975_07545, partial [Stegodyphus mimosarum]
MFPIFSGTEIRRFSSTLKTDSFFKLAIPSGSTLIRFDDNVRSQRLMHPSISSATS